MNLYLSKKKREIIWFLINGGISFLMSIALLYCLVTFIDLHYLLATTVTFVVITFLSYLLNKKYAFQTERHYFSQEVQKYYLVALSSLGLNLLSMYVLIEFFSAHLVVASILTGAWLLIYNYVLHAFWSFKNSKG